MASAKKIYASGMHASTMYRAGMWRGVGVTVAVAHYAEGKLFVYPRAEGIMDATPRAEAVAVVRPRAEGVIV